MSLITKLLSTAATKSIIKTVGETTVHTAAGVAYAVNEANKNKKTPDTVVYVNSKKNGGTMAEDVVIKIKAPNISEFIGGHYLKARAALVAAGFQDISYIVKRDITTGWFTSDGDVEEISIGGQTEIGRKAMFTPETPVVIVYHTYKNAPAVTTTSKQTVYPVEVNNSQPQNNVQPQNTILKENDVSKVDDDPQIFCVSCGTKQSMSNTYCLRCGSVIKKLT